MAGTALNHPLVRDYLRELDTALAGLPAEQAGELREQITSHLDDVLGPEASDQEAAAALGRLGSPRELAAEAGAGPGAAAAGAGAGTAPAEVQARGRRRPLRTALARLSWRARLILAAAIIATGGATGYTVAAFTAGGLASTGEQGWWYSQDAAHQVMTQADSAMQTTVPIRPGQRQGLWFDVYNPSGWSQTVIGFGSNSGHGPDAEIAQLGVAAKGRTEENPASLDTGGYRLPEVIPPHSWRIVRVMWTNSPCEPGEGIGSVDGFTLSVRVGIFTRSETIPLAQAYALSSSGPASPCIP
jgi:hypothetical protein